MTLRNLILLLFIAMVYAEGSVDENKSDDGKPYIPQLSKYNFTEYVNARKVVLVEFFAPWCGHCKSLAPEYEKAVSMLAARDPPIRGVMVKVDGTQERDLHVKYEANGFPSIKLIRDGKLAGEYTKERTAQALYDYMVEQMDPNYKPPVPSTVRLTKDNFTDFVKKTDYCLVQFYAPWSSESKEMAKEYENAAKALLKKDPPIPLVLVDATEEPELATQYKIVKYPTLKIFHKGKAFTYHGATHADGIVRDILKYRNDVCASVSDIKELKKLMRRDTVFILGYFPDDNSDFRQEFIDATNYVRDHYPSCAIIKSADLVKSYGMTKQSLVLIQPEKYHTKYEPPYWKFDKADATSDDIVNFIKNNTLPLVGQYTWGTSTFYDEIKDKAVCIAFYTVDFSHEYIKATQLWRLKLVEIANDHKDTVVFAVAHDEQQEDKLKTFGLADTGADMNIGCMKDGLRYPMPEMDEYDDDQIRSFVNDVLSGKAKPYLKSRKAPAVQTGPVTVVVADSFKELVTDPKMDVLIEFYIKSCQHCKEFEQKYEAMANKLAHIKTLRIARMDTEDNDVLPPFEISSYPTIYFQPAGAKSPFLYSGPRTEEEIIIFMEKLAKVSKEGLTAELGKASKRKKEEL